VHRPAGYAGFATFEPTFLYELIFDLALAGALVWLIHHRHLLAPGIFALYVIGYSAFRIFEETQRVDPAHHILGERLNFWVSCLLTLAGLAWFIWTQSPGRRARAHATQPAAGAGSEARAVAGAP